MTMASIPLPSTTTRWIRRLRPLAWGGAISLLLAPWVAMRFTPDVVWTGSDFAVFGAMLLAGCVAFELAARAARAPAYLAASVIALAAAFLLAWANLAVGVVGEPEHPVNLAYFGVLLAGAIGACLSRLQADGMAKTLVVMAALQLGAGILGMIANTSESPGFLPGFTGLYMALWTFSAALYRRAAGDAVERA